MTMRTTLRRPSMAALFPLALLPAVVGCTHWPEPGGGGLAELRAPASVAGTADTPGLEVLHTRLACDMDRLTQLREIAMERGVLGGRVALVEQIAARAQREYYGGLTADAARTLDRLDKEALLLRAALPPGAATPIRECL